MKLNVVIFVLFLAANVFAQTDPTSVDLQKIVKEQFELAKAKEEYKTLTSEATDKKTVESTSEEKVDVVAEQDTKTDGKIDKADILKMLEESGISDESTAKETLSDNQESVVAKTDFPVRKPYVVKRIPLNKSESSFGWKFLLIAVAAMLAGGFVIVRRRLHQNKKQDGQSIKKNIKLIREEQVIKKDLNPYLKQIRKQLKDSAGRGDIDEKVVTETARKLRISREEILLANRIHKHEMKKA